ncbi:MAG: hypothetical protein H9W81_07805 [Enterococcus sp.]|nr:hypothetical protein [Enterococcus sp.]
MAKTLEHLQTAEIETYTGYRYWTGPMEQSEMSAFLASEAKRGNGLSDMSCIAECPACESEE